MAMVSARTDVLPGKLHVWLVASSPSIVTLKSSLDKGGNGLADVIRKA